MDVSNVNAIRQKTMPTNTYQEKKNETPYELHYRINVSPSAAEQYVTRFQTVLCVVTPTTATTINSIKITRTLVALVVVVVGGGPSRPNDVANVGDFRHDIRTTQCFALASRPEQSALPFETHKHTMPPHIHQQPSTPAAFSIGDLTHPPHHHHTTIRFASDRLLLINEQ